MSNWRAEAAAAPATRRRVRDEVRDGVAVIVTSALASTILAVVTTLLMKLVG
jgi:preprotein translocase subunit SecE